MLIIAKTKEYDEALQGVTSLDLRSGAIWVGVSETRLKSWEACNEMFRHRDCHSWDWSGLECPWKIMGLPWRVQMNFPLNLTCFHVQVVCVYVCVYLTPPQVLRLNFQSLHVATQRAWFGSKVWMPRTLQHGLCWLRLSPASISLSPALLHETALTWGSSSHTSPLPIEVLFRSATWGCRKGIGKQKGLTPLLPSYSYCFCCWLLQSWPFPNQPCCTHPSEQPSQTSGVPSSEAQALVLSSGFSGFSRPQPWLSITFCRDLTIALPSSCLRESRCCPSQVFFWRHHHWHHMLALVCTLTPLPFQPVNIW